MQKRKPYTNYINRRGNRNCTEDINRCMIQKIYVDYISGFVSCMRKLDFIFIHRSSYSHLPSYTFHTDPKILVYINQTSTSVVSTNHIRYLPDSTN